MTIPTEILSKAQAIYEGSWPDPVTAIAEALMEARGQCPHLVESPLLGIRFKLSFNKAGNCTTFYRGQAEELDGQWVWLVDATDGRNNPRTMSPEALADHINALQQIQNEIREVNSI